MMTDKNYKEISDEVYKVDSGKYNPLIEGQVIDNKYKILALEDNQNNGMQAMAIAPVNDRGEVDTSKIVIAYAGTRVGDRRDIDTDVQQVCKGEKKT